MSIITAHIRRMGKGTVFSLFVSPHLDRVGGVSLPRSRQGGTPGRGGEGYPVLGSGGVLHPVDGGSPSS